MNRLLRRIVVVFMVMFGLAGAAGADECAGTGMIADEERKFSVMMPKVPGMGAQSFNDIGCAVLFWREECASRASLFESNAAAYDYQSGEPLPVEKAYFVLKTGVETPKGFGIVAFKDRAEAEKFAGDHGNGKVVKWFELVEEKLK